MRRCSETIAAAVTKAQGELTNPEKSLVATVQAAAPGGGRSHLPLRLAGERA